MNLIEYINYYISLVKRFADFKVLRVVVEDVSNPTIIHEESFYF